MLFHFMPPVAATASRTRRRIRRSIQLLFVELLHVRRQAHRAERIAAVRQPEAVADLVQRFLAHAHENSAWSRQAVELLAQPASDRTAAAVELRLAVDEREHRDEMSRSVRTRSSPPPPAAGRARRAARASSCTDRGRVVRVRRIGNGETARLDAESAARQLSTWPWPRRLPPAAAHGEHAHPASPHRLRVDRTHRHGGLQRQRDAERAALADAGHRPRSRRRARSTMPYTTARPRPTPLPSSFVVKNGSKIFRSSSGGIPGPGVASPRERPRRRPARPRPDRHSAASLDGLGAVEHQVHHDLLDLRGVAADARQAPRPGRDPP